MFSFASIPFAIGGSPFRCKGVLYIDALEYLNAEVRGGPKALLRRFENPALNEYFDKPFLVGGWYDIFPLLGLISSASVSLAIPQLELTRTIARVVVPKQFRGLYKFLLKMASPDVTMRNLPRVGNAYFDFVKVTVAQIKPNTFTSQGSGIPAIAASTYMAVTEIGVVLALELAGAKHVRHRWLPQTQEGNISGLDIVRVQREISWD